MLSFFVRGFGAVLLLSLTANTVAAKPKVRTKTVYYNISGTSVGQLKAQMRNNGPQGKWAWTVWFVRWTNKCKTTVDVTYTYPKWTDKADAPETLQKNWERMIANLRKHEEGHGQHGVNAARAIEKKRCRGKPMSIIEKWARQDKVYDRKTQSGFTQGVVLK